MYAFLCQFQITRCPLVPVFDGMCYIDSNYSSLHLILLFISEMLCLYLLFFT